MLLSRLDALLASSGRAVGTAKVELFEKLQELLSDDDVRLLAQQLRRSASLLLVSASKDDKLRKSLAKPALRACLEKPIQWLCSHTLRFEAQRAASDDPNGATAEPEDLHTMDVDALVSKVLACVENMASGRMLGLLVDQGQPTRR